MPQKSEKSEKSKKSVLLRLDPEMWNEIASWADDEFRSINGQIEYILHEVIIRRKKGKRGSSDDIQK